MILYTNNCNNCTYIEKGPIDNIDENVLCNQNTLWNFNSVVLKIKVMF